MCTADWKEMISHYTERASNVYMCSLGATKAFDKVNVVKSFKLLLQWNIPSIVLRLILDLYTSNSVTAAWNCKRFFPLSRMKLDKVVCCLQFNLMSISMSCYTVCKRMILDVIQELFSQEPYVMPRSCYFCVQQSEDSRKWWLYAANLLQNVMSFLFSKTACMAFRNRHLCLDLHLYLNGKMLEWTDTFKQLGNVITADQKDDSDIQLKRGHPYRSVDGLCYKFKGTLLNSDVATGLFQTYCCSFYGSQAWNLSSSSFEFICTAWNKAVRRISHYHAMPIDIFFHL